MWPASTASPSETSSIAVATGPSRRPSAVRIGGRRSAPLAERRPGAAERARDDDESPGCAPARPGTRSERPSAVTLTTTRPALVVSPPRTGTPASAIPS